LRRTAAELNLPNLEPVGAQTKASAPESSKGTPESSKGTQGEAIPDAPPPPAVTEVASTGEDERSETAQSAEPSSCLGSPPLSSILLNASTPGATSSEHVNEIPIGLIEDDLLRADLCNDVANSLH
jgi:hypothetical protein